MSTRSPRSRHPEGPRQATIRDVAHAARVSVATVSRALNDSGPVRDDTRRRVRDAAENLRFTPHGGARSLITSRTNTLGVLLPDLYGEFFSEIIRGIDRGAQRAGYQLLLSSARNAHDEVHGAFRAMYGRVDGLVLMAPDVELAELFAQHRDGTPIVFINSPVASEDARLITIDNHGGAYRMVKHLVRKGHQRIAIIRGAESNHDAAERLRGYRDALDDGGLPRDPRLEFHGDFTETAGYRAGRAALRLRPRPTAIFAANDAMAIGALSALREEGVAVPGEIAVAGFDDIPIARYVSPPLSSVHVPIAQLGERAMELLLGAIAGRENGAARRVVLPTTLVIRKSSP
ncbi:MAG TPA: LacI family DNA-binding transcriptional regulator [Gemmatimonadaceae bacterium]|nr:LacI family DNA-binding transcriptional regulator [Gemmatimonadaceae bacterium]